MHLGSLSFFLRLLNLLVAKDAKNSHVTTTSTFVGKKVFGLVP